VRVHGGGAPTRQTEAGNGLAVYPAPHRAPWRKAGDGDNIDIAYEVIGGGALLYQLKAAVIPFQRIEDRDRMRLEVMDDLFIVLDVLGWELRSKNDPSTARWPMAAPHPLTPAWCEPIHKSAT
jgi:hypothetical protein